MIDTAIYLLLTVLVPLHQTYKSMKDHELEDLQLWSIYWAIFSLIKSLQWMIQFFDAVPFQFLFLLVLLWLYHENFKGALFLQTMVKKFISSNEGIANVINMISQKLAFLPVFDTTPVIQKAKKQ